MQKKRFVGPRTPTKRIRKPKIIFSPSQPTKTFQKNKLYANRFEIRSETTELKQLIIYSQIRILEEKNTEGEEDSQPTEAETFEEGGSEEYESESEEEPSVHQDEEFSESDTEDEDILCHCGVVHTSANLKEQMQGVPAPSKDEKGFKHTGWHTCQNLWLETTFRVSNKLFICLACSANDKVTYWCYRGAPQIHNVKRHYTNVHKNDPIVQTFIETTNNKEYSSGQLNKDMLEWIVNNNHPFALIDEVELRKIIIKLNPSMKLLHRQQLISKYLPIIGNETDSKVNSFLSSKSSFY